MGVIRRCGVQDLVIRAEPQDRVRHLIGRLTLRKMADALQHQPLVTPAEVVLASAEPSGWVQASAPPCSTRVGSARRGAGSKRCSAAP